MNSPLTIPDHTLLRPIGRGSYGEVWLARNVMGVLRAVKIVERRHFDDARPYEREFAGIQRYEPASRLADGLVHVLHVGRNDEAGYFYYVMELADDATAGVAATSAFDNAAGQGGSSIESYVPRTLRSDMKSMQRLPVADCIRVALDVVSGLVKLHEQGLVHRDVKPGNIIFVNARAKLADIGLVSRGGEGRTFVGTEGYIPPEGPGSSAADLYALGMALYEAVTGFAPERFPQVPAEWFAESAGTEALEFHEVLLKACEGARERRYATAEQMQADLALLQSGQSVRRVRQLERRAARTQRFAAAAGILVALAVASALVAGWRARIAAKMHQRESVLLQEARDARAKESDARARAENAEREAREQLGAARFEQARALVMSREIGHRTRALEALQQASGAANMAELRRIALSALSLPDLRFEQELTLDPSHTLIQPDPKLERIALAHGEGAVTVHTFPGLQPIVSLPSSTNRPCFVGVWSADGRFLALKRQHDVDGTRSTWEGWDVGATQRVVLTRPDAAYSSVTFHPRRPLFMAGHNRGQVTEWDMETGREQRTFQLPGTPHVLAYSPDGRRFVACYRNNSKWTIAFHDSATLEPLQTVPYSEPIEIVAWHPSGRWITGTGITASEYKRGVRLVDADIGAITSLGEHKIKMACGDFPGAGDYLVSGGWDREIIFWDLRTMQRAFTFPGTAYRTFWDAQGARGAVWFPEGMFRVFSFEQPGDRHLPGETPGIVTALFSPNGRWLLARCARELRLWDLSNSAPAAVFARNVRTTPFFSPDSTQIFAVADEYSERGYAGRWRLAPATQPGAAPTVETLPVHFPKGAMRASLVNDEVVVTGDEGVAFAALSQVDAPATRAVRVTPGAGYPSPDGQFLAMRYNFSPLVTIYRLPHVTEIARIQTSNYVAFITFSPDGKEMLVLNRSGAEWFNTATWECTRRQPSMGVSGSYAFYTPDSSAIWMVRHSRSASLLDRRTLDPILSLPNDTLPVAFSPDGKHLAVSVDGKRMRLWDMEAIRAQFQALGLDW